MVICCQNLTIGALSSLSALSVLVGTLFKKVWSLFEHALYRIFSDGCLKQLFRISCTAIQGVCTWSIQF